ncbi:MAG: type I methionyl aminopeptidase [Patescibacteria group bacterium]
MSLTKTKTEIEKMRAGGALLSRALTAAIQIAHAGVKVCDLNSVAENEIIKGGGTPSFKGYRSSKAYPPFPSTLCVSINEEIVHGLGNRKIELKQGDIVGLDIGCWYQGLCTDMAATVFVDNASDNAKQLLRVTREALIEAIESVKIGGKISDIGEAVEKHVKPYGYGIVRSLTGHGVGHEVHEEPHIPNFITKQFPEIEIVEGMCLAIEPMIALGDYLVETADDGWAAVMKDKSIGAHFEVTIAVTEAGVEILTPLPV